MFSLATVVLVPRVFFFESTRVVKCQSTPMAVPEKGKPTIRCVVFILVGLALVVISELVDGDEGVSIGFKETIDHFEDLLCLGVRCTLSNGIRRY